MKIRVISTIAFIVATSAFSFGQRQKGEDLLRDAVLSNAIRAAGITTVRPGGEVSSKKNVKVPVKIIYVIKTDKDNIRLRYGADQIIFNWERDRGQLRIDGGPAAGRHVNGAGGVPPKKFVTIVQEVTPDRMTISVDGIQRASWDADFSKIDEPIGVFAGRSVLTIRSINAEKP